MTIKAQLAILRDLNDQGYKPDFIAFVLDCSPSFVKELLIAIEKS